jgi:hypothetical protein
MKATNYIKVTRSKRTVREGVDVDGIPVRSDTTLFFFDGDDEDDLRRKWHLASAHQDRMGGTVSLYRQPVHRGVWDFAPIIGVTS